MNAKQINSILKHNSWYGGCFARNSQLKRRKSPVAYVINTDSKSEKGEHWVVLVILSSNKCEYFDPLGFPPLHADFVKLTNFCGKKSLIYSSKCIQNPSSSLCGNYCIDFINKRSKGWSMSRYLGQFSRNTTINDQLMYKIKQKQMNLMK